MKKKTKKCPTCKGKGKIKINDLGLTKEEDKKLIEIYNKMSD